MMRPPVRSHSLESSSSRLVSLCLSAFACASLGCSENGGLATSAGTESATADGTSSPDDSADDGNTGESGNEDSTGDDGETTDGSVPTNCMDGLDNDGDGWVDEDDPDCEDGDERGFGDDTCNDGVDNDGDLGIDKNDPDCASGHDDEVLGDGPCADECILGTVHQGRSCQVWHVDTQSWSDTLQTGDGHLHDRARVYVKWLRERLLPAGGVMRGHFSDSTYDQIQLYAGTRDSPIWTGIYLASEALRYEQTGSLDAREQALRSIEVLDRWWRISGDRGYLARYAAPASSPAPILDILATGNPENHRDVAFEGDTWHWKGNISRDQYQGAFFGYAMAYDLIDDEAHKEIIRANIVATVEQLMEKKTVQVNLTVDGVPVPTSMELQHVIYTDDETPSGVPALDITTSPFDAAQLGFLSFWPNATKNLRQLPLLSWLPDIYQRSQAVQLGGMFATALHVTEGVDTYASRRAAIQAHYDVFFPEWIDMAKGWEDNNTCGSSYHGVNIAFLPAFNWARLEANPIRRQNIVEGVLDQRMWAAVADHKNVFFAYIYASQTSENTASVVASHTDQLRQFPPPPNVSIAVDNTGNYPEDPNCPGLSSIAIDVADREPTSFLWERQPWKLVAPLEPNKLYPGVDYLITYWMARSYGYLDDDAAGTCLQWRD